MPTVPISRRQIQTQAAPSQNLRAADFGIALTSIGSGMERLGKEASEAADDWDRIKDERRVNDAKRADAEDALYLNKRLRVDEDAYLQRQGVNARGIASQAQEEIRKTKEARLAKIEDPEARDLYSRMFDTRAAAEMASVASHEREQARVETVETAEAGIRSFAGLAVDASQDREKFDATLGDGLREIGTLGTAKGWSA